MIKLDDNLLQELGLGSLPPEDKKKMLAHIYETLEMRVGMELAKQMTEAQLTEFESFINRNDEAGALRWLETNFPNYKDVVAAEFEKLKNEIRQVAPQIVGAAVAAGAPQASGPIQPYAQDTAATPSLAYTAPQYQPQAPATPSYQHYPQQPPQQAATSTPYGSPVSNPAGGVAAGHPHYSQNPHVAQPQPGLSGAPSAAGTSFQQSQSLPPVQAHPVPPSYSPMQQPDPAATYHAVPTDHSGAGPQAVPPSAPAPYQQGPSQSQPSHHPHQIPPEDRQQAA